MKRTRRWLIMLSLIPISGIIPALQAQTAAPATGQLQRYGAVDVSKLSPLSKAGAKLMLHHERHKDIDAQSPCLAWSQGGNPDPGETPDSGGLLIPELPVSEEML